MAAVIIMVGVPGSGKDYFIEHHKKPEDVVVSSDAIRAELGDINDQTRNAEVFSIFYSRLDQALKDGKVVWVNATNVTKQGRADIISRANKYKATVQCVLMNIPIEQCILQDSLRDRTVGEEVIRKFERRFEYPDFDEGIDCISVVTEKDFCND